jgi:hypothetical protein
MQSDAPLTSLQLFNLYHARVAVNKNNPLHLLELNGETPQGVDPEKNPPNVVTISIKFTISAPLNHCLQQKARVAQVWLRSLRVDIDLVTKPGEYCFE